MRFGEVYDYRTAEEAKKFIGKKGLFSDYLKILTEISSRGFEDTLKKVDNEELCPFCGYNANSAFQFFRPILEDEELMTNRQLAEWLAKGNGEYTSDSERAISAFIVWSYPKGEEDKIVRNDVLIRRWKDTEWSKPTKAIYEEDCLTHNAINKEDCR